MTRERLAPGTVLQQAYGVLDKYKISRTFFVKTDQSDCMFSDPAAIPPDANQQKSGEVKSEPVKEAMPMPAEPEMVKEPVMAEAEKPVKIAKPEMEKKPVETMQKPVEAAPMPAAPVMAPVAEEPVKPVPAPAPVKEEPVKVAHEKVESAMKQ